MRNRERRNFVFIYRRGKRPAAQKKGGIPLKDRKLLRDLKKREPDALDRIMDKYGGYVSMIVFYTMGAGACREDGEEIAADVFLSLWEKAERIGDDVCLRSYLAAMARNRATDRLRSRQYREGLHTGCGKTEETERVEDERHSEDPVIRAEENDVLLQALRQLSREDQMIFFRYYYIGETAAAVAEKTGMKEATVRTRLERGRKKLKRILREGGYFDVQDVSREKSPETADMRKTD